MSIVILVLESGDRNWSAYFPDVPGCVATGATRAETIERAREALAFHVEGLRLFTVDDPRLWESRPQLSPEEFAIQGLSGEEWEAFHATIEDRDEADDIAAFDEALAEEGESVAWEQVRAELEEEEER